MDFSGGSDSKESACSAGDPRLISGSIRSPGEGNGNSLKYSCLENPMNRGAWQATIPGIAESDIAEQLTIGYILHGLEDNGKDKEKLSHSKILCSL